METGLTERFAEAAKWAAELHNDHVRKGTSIPYVSHLFAVASLVLEDGGDEDQAVAALLHDAVEDQKTDLATVRSRFGDEVADIVEACSDTDEDPKPPWRERKQRYLDGIAHKSDAALRVSNADKVHNARSLIADYRRWGNVLWDHFNADARFAEAQLWYYGELADAIWKRLYRSPLAGELLTLVAELRRLVEEPVRYQATYGYSDGKVGGLFRCIGTSQCEAFVPRDGGWRHSPVACDMFMWDDIRGIDIDEATADEIARDFVAKYGPAMPTT